ncbi:MAG: endonuclease/exonuclease/phosphatase family protein [Reichenbachiella sp.]|uniref:endonuclease/exonuclease/phosphatase family protein n=1 Tax=Reichenbachiella sp. TaxID=2184521 RepID=UPI0032998705
MKALLLILLVLSLMVSPSFGQTLDIISFNIRYDNPNDGENAWPNRKSELVELINYYHPDFVGSQEGLDHQIKYVNNHLQDYTSIGVGREDGRTQGEFAAIFYDSTKYQLVRQNTFWLSEKPNKVSIGWDAALERICTYGLFKEKSTENLVYVFNVHFDHVGVVARKMSAKLILEKIDELTDENSTVVLMGDLNCHPNSAPIVQLRSALSDGMEISKNSFYGPNGTFNAFDSSHELTERIDYIFTQNLHVLSYRHIDDRRKDKGFISDHLPVLLKAKMNSTNTN